MNKTVMYVEECSTKDVKTPKYPVGFSCVAAGPLWRRKDFNPTVF